MYSGLITSFILILQDNPCIHGNPICQQTASSPVGIEGRTKRSAPENILVSIKLRFKKSFLHQALIPTSLFSDLVTSVKKEVNSEFTKCGHCLLFYSKFTCVLFCCSQCSRNPQEAIESRVGTLGETFLREYVQVNTDLKWILTTSDCNRMLQYRSLVTAC